MVAYVAMFHIRMSLLDLYMSQNRKPSTDDLSKAKYGKTWAVSEDASVSQALSEVLRAAMADQNIPESRGVLFYIANESKPIVVTGEDVIRIGRQKDKSEDNLTLDLEPYFGAELGVSRYHAEIIFNENRYFIKDMGSTNGTWINGKKIAPYRQIPLTDSDQLRLGHFTMLLKFIIE